MDTERDSKAREIAKQLIDALPSAAQPAWSISYAIEAIVAVADEYGVPTDPDYAVEGILASIRAPLVERYGRELVHAALVEVADTWHRRWTCQ
jgi:hypothetical protein